MTLIQDKPPETEHPEHMQPMVAVPYIAGMLHQETVDSVAASGYPYTLWQLDRQDPYAYAALFAQLWVTPGTLIIVEQDMVVPPGAIGEMVTCEQLWCSHLYHTGTPVKSYGLGLCRFDRYIKDTYPTLGEQAARDYHGTARRMRYEALNERVIGLMLHWGYQVHLHQPDAGHLHVYEAADGDAG